MTTPAWAQAAQQVGDCLLFRGCKNVTGYGQVKVAGKTYLAHRFVLMQKTPPPTPTSLALHSCDNPACINVDHLRWGSHADNMRDMRSRDRGCKVQPLLRALSESDAAAARTRYVPRCKINGMRALAREFGVSKACMQNLLDGRTYAVV